MKNSANKELYLLSSLIQDIKFLDESKNDLNDLAMMENLAKYFLNRQALTFDFIKSSKKPIEKIEFFIKMIDNIKVDNKDKIRVFSNIINYLISLDNFDIKFIDTKNLFVSYDNQFNCEIDLYKKIGVNSYRNKLYTDGTFKYNLKEDIQDIKCNKDCNYLMQVAVDNKKNTLIKNSWISIKDLNLVLPAIEEIKKEGFPKIRIANSNSVTMDNISDIDFIESYDKLDLERYKILVKK